MKVSSQPYQESLWLLSHLLNEKKSFSHENEILQKIYLGQIKITEKQEQIFWDKIQRRKNNYPLDYLLERKHFLNHSFYIQPGVFIPRKETEVLVTKIFKQYPQNQALKIMDWGAGVGTIALSLLAYFFKSECFVVDIHEKSLDCLKKNKDLFGFKDRVFILKEDVSHLKKENFIKSVDLIVANPPYIDPKDEKLHSQVYWFEPCVALFSDQKGMGHIYSWFYQALDFLKSGAYYAFEFGWNQSQLVRDFLKTQKNISYEILKDSLTYDRVAFVCKR
ncbi:MAG: peptide chain release factor N(5)-glutamine methyltransferase [Bdellovibrionales bacterium]|nr:peptide chain release factor N(5)-glutamine methyltransferase [Bdellovibrionales bacterium]